ncbi:MAG: hydrogenase iron-sulfur subunit [Chloroflexi bacterium]|nr:hydrogenase iron-sulfur subunit [Chloroflexota bacterium]
MNNSKIKINLLCCSTSFDPLELAQGNNGNGDELRIIPLPCSGKIDILYLTKAFESGADGVAVITCKKGECQFLEGNLRAEKRVSAVDTLLEEIGLGKGRMVMMQMGDGGIDQIKKEVEDFRRRIKASPRKAYAGDELELDKE